MNRLDEFGEVIGEQREEVNIGLEGKEIKIKIKEIKHRGDFVYIGGIVANDGRSSSA